MKLSNQLIYAGALTLLWTVSSSVGPVWGQGEAPPKTATAADPDAAAKAKLEIVGEGELRLDGKITAILGAGVWEMQATSWTSPRGVTTDFDELKKKGVQVGATANIHPRGELLKVPLAEVKLGSRIAVIGKNGEDGIVAREVVLLEGYGSRKTVGQVGTNPITFALVGQSRQARDEGQLPKAMTLIDRAIAAAQGMNDKSGEGLATQDKALLYSDMQQPEQALATFRRVSALGRESGSNLLTVLGLRGAGGTLMEAGKLSEAIALLKEADSSSATSEVEIRYGVLTVLAEAYLLNGQLNDGVATMARVQSIEQGQGKDADAGETLLTIALLQADEKPDSARQALEEGKVRLERARDDKAKGSLTGAMALVQWRLGEKEQARTGFAEAAKLYAGAGSEPLAKHWEGMAALLETSGEGWQEFYGTISGAKSLMSKPTEGDATEAPAENAGGGA